MMDAMREFLQNFRLPEHLRSPVLRPLLDEMSVQTDKRVVASSYFFADISGK